MSRTSVGTRSLVRAGASAVIVALVISITALPAAAGAVPAVNNFNPDQRSRGHDGPCLRHFTEAPPWCGSTGPR